MSGIMAKTVHPTCALVAYTIVTALVFGGLLVSPFDMFVLVGLPTCMDGTTSSPYPYTIPTPGVASPTTGPNAPNKNSVPFCTSDALFNSYKVHFNAYGYLGTATGATNLFAAGQTITVTPFCFKKSNGTCPTFGDLGVNTAKVTTAIADGTLQYSDANNLVQAVSGSSFTNNNNIPLTFGPAGTTMPGGVDISKTYYMRNFNSATGTFNIAVDTTSPPIAKFSSPLQNSVTVTFPSMASCATQQNVKASTSADPANVNADGTLKTGSCGYCLSKQQQAGVLAVPGLCGITIALLLIMEIMMCIPAVRKLGFFRILVIVFSVLCIIFLIAAVASAATMFYQIAMCYTQTDLSKAQFMGSPTAPAINGYTPSLGGADLQPTGGAGLFSTVQLSGNSAYLKPLLLPSLGAVQIIIAIVFLFFFTIVFAIKTDWTAVSSSGEAGSGAMMTPR